VVGRDVRSHLTGKTVVRGEIEPAERPRLPVVQSDFK